MYKYVYRYLSSYHHSRIFAANVLDWSGFCQPNYMIHSCKQNGWDNSKILKLGYNLILLVYGCNLCLAGKLVKPNYGAANFSWKTVIKLNSILTAYREISRWLDLARAARFRDYLLPVRRVLIDYILVLMYPGIVFESVQVVPDIF